MARRTPRECPDQPDTPPPGYDKPAINTPERGGHADAPPPRLGLDAARNAGWAEQRPAAPQPDDPRPWSDVLRRTAERDAAIAQAKEALRPLMERAALAKQQIDGIAADVALEQGGLVRTTVLKSIDRAAQKAVTDYDGRVDRLKDIARNTIVVPPDRIDATIAAVAATEGALVKRSSAENDPLGYSGAIVNIPCNGMYAEIQVNSPDMIYAKDIAGQRVLGAGLSDAIAAATGAEPGLGHGFYERHRNLDPLAPDAIRIAQESRDYYDGIRRGSAAIPWKRFFDSDGKS